MNFNDFNDIRTAEREGRLRDYSIDQLRAMSATCARWKQSGNRDDADTKDSVDKEIHRKETEEVEQRTASRDREKIETIRNLDAKVSTIDGRMSAIELKSSRPEFRTWGFWFAFIAIIIALVSWIFPRSPSVESKAIAISTNRISPQLSSPTNSTVVQFLQSSVTSNSSIQSGAPKTNIFSKP